MADIPDSPPLRHQWLGSHLGDAQDYWLINLIHQNAADLRPPSQDILGRNWTFPAMVAKHALSSKPVLSIDLLDSLLTHFPEALQEPDTMAWVVAGFVHTHVWTKNATALDATPAAQALFEQFRRLSEPQRHDVAQTTQHKLAEQAERDWHRRPEKLATHWMGRQHALDLLCARAPEVPQPLAQSLHAVALTVLWQCAGTYQAETTNAGQTQCVLEDLQRMAVTPALLERTIGQIAALDTPQTGLEERVFRWTLAANLASGIPACEVTHHPAAQASLIRFNDQTDFIRSHLPYAERQENGKALESLALRVQGRLTAVRANDLNERLAPATRGGRSPRM